MTRPDSRDIPLLISVPHASLLIPEEIQEHLAVPASQLAEEIDTCVDKVFATPRVRHTLVAPVSRFVVDVNRPRDAGGEGGVVPTADFHGKPLYKRPYEVTPAEVQRRLRLYYDPYHQAIQEALKDQTIRFFIDAHAMEPVGPSRAADAGTPRPDICLSNLGDHFGLAQDGGHYITCSAEALRAVRDSFKRQFRGSRLEVTFNVPFRGGYITEWYGNPLGPYYCEGCQIEINKALYCAGKQQEPHPERIAELNEKLCIVIQDLYELLCEIDEESE